MENKKRFVSMKEWGRKEYGKNAIVAIAGGVIASRTEIIIIQIIGDVLLLAGFICGIIWLYRLTTHKV